MWSRCVNIGPIFPTSNSRRWGVNHSFLGQIRNPVPLTILNNQLHASKYVEISYKTMSNYGFWGRLISMDGIIWVPSWPRPTWDACDRKARALEDAQEASEAYLWRRDALRFEPRHFFWEQIHVDLEINITGITKFHISLIFPSIFIFIIFIKCSSVFFFFIHFHQFSFIHVHQFSSHFHPVFISFHSFSSILSSTFPWTCIIFRQMFIHSNLLTKSVFSWNSIIQESTIPAEEEQRAQQLRRVLRSESEASEVGAAQLKKHPRECRLFLKNKSA